MVDGRGFMADEKAPGGYICRVDPDGKDWELVSMGFRNPYDLAFNRARGPVHVRLRHGVGHEHPLVSADPR